VYQYNKRIVFRSIIGSLILGDVICYQKRNTQIQLGSYLDQGCTYPGYKVAVGTNICTVELNSCGYSV